jgi:anaphase-promoting complex subunit 4
VDVISSETGSPVQIFRQVTTFLVSSSPESQNEVTCIGWGLNLVNPSVIRSKSSSSTDDDSQAQELEIGGNSKLNLDELLDRGPDIEATGIPTELSDQLAQLDVTHIMPRLPTLTMPSTSLSRSAQSGLAELFSSQALLDSALHRGYSREIHALNVFLLADQKGSIRVIVYDSLSIGNISLPFDGFQSFRHIRHAAHPSGHCHVLLSEIKDSAAHSRIALVPISFRFLKSAGKNIHFIDSKTAQLEILVQYVGEAILAIEQHWRAANELPSRFQQSVSEALGEKQEPNLIQSLYQLAATGYCSTTMKEWLTAELAERVSYRPFSYIAFLTGD